MNFLILRSKVSGNNEGHTDGHGQPNTRRAPSRAVNTCAVRGAKYFDRLRSRRGDAPGRRRGSSAIFVGDSRDASAQ